MSRSQAFRRLRPSVVVPAVLVAAALATTSISGLAPTPGTTLGHELRLVDANAPTDGMSYDMTTGQHADLANRYDAIINDIRNRLRGTRLYGNITLTQRQDDYFPVTLAMGNNQVTLVFNARNLYVVGYRNDPHNTYYRFGEGPATMAGATPQNVDWLNYGDMERAAGISRGDLNIGLGPIQSAVTVLGSTANTSNRARARALLVIVQALAEGARFDFISYRVSQAIRGGHQYTTGTSSSVSENGSGSSHLSATGLDFENNWQGISNAAENSTQNGTAPHYAIGNGHLNTMRAIDAQLAVALSR
ncbi:ribosome-inactivating family protein [Streptomyces sp. NPDC088196]|uniref:ribosome-inactivating family protein n=1 Tax=Streptomyces sp. NPDC088196 TaxID=3154868 RepID=UPI00344F8E44